jgi:hypothetical protein
VVAGGQRGGRRPSRLAPDGGERRSAATEAIIPIASSPAMAARLTSGPSATACSASRRIAMKASTADSVWRNEAEVLHERPHEHEQRHEPDQRERVGEPDDERVGGDAERGGDRVDGERDVGGDEREQRDAARGDEPVPSALEEEAAVRRVARQRQDATDRADGQAALGIGVLVAPAKRTDGDHEQQRAEHVGDDVEAGDERGAGEDRDRPHDQREGDPPHHHAAAVLPRDLEEVQDQQEDEDVVERERALDDVDGGVAHRPVGARQRRQRQARRQPDDEPCEARPGSPLRAQRPFVSGGAYVLRDTRRARPSSTAARSASRKRPGPQ